MVRIESTDGDNQRLIKHKTVWVIVVVAIALALLFPPNAASNAALVKEIADVPHETKSHEVQETKEEVVWTFETLVPYLAQKYGQDESLARAIIRCESKNRAHAKGDNYNKEGVYWSSDWGYWQINDYWNQATAKRRGYDIKIWQENLEYGFIMLKEQGTQPWLASSYCWNV